MALVAIKSRFLIPWCSNARMFYGRCRIGCRDVVGYGINGSYNYRDDVLWPFPAIRFKENSTDICALREKEKGDWKQLCCEEKKALYRASFCQTFAEFQAPTGHWKFVIGYCLMSMSMAFWFAMFYHYYVYEGPLPKSFCKASQQAQLRRMLELRVNPIDGISSLWDYDNERWKRYVIRIKHRDPECAEAWGRNPECRGRFKLEALYAEDGRRHKEAIEHLAPSSETAKADTG